MKDSIVTHFAPSPTGLLHVGNYRTALFSYLFARQNEGKAVLRIEDTDRARSKKEYADNIHESLAWLGLSFDETFIQSEMISKHTEALEKLVASGSAYISKEKNTEGKENDLVRFKNPNTVVTFTDLIRGEISVDTTDLKDFVIAKNLKEPLFHLAVVVDDATAKVTHVIRGEDHISNTPRQILIRRALGLPDVEYAHIPLVFATDKSKLSKRRGAKAITEYRDAGYLPQAMINFMALLGWNPGGEQEVFEITEIIKLFDISKIQKGGAVFNEEKLRWFNKEHLKRLSMEAQKVAIEEWFKTSSKKIVLEEDMLNKLHPVVMERISVWSDIHTLIDTGEFDFLFEEPTFEKEALVWKTEKDPEQTRAHLETVENSLKEIAVGDFNTETIKNAVWDYALKTGKGNVLWPLRYALSGKEKSPDPFTLASLLGKEKTLERIIRAKEMFDA